MAGARQHGDRRVERVGRPGTRADVGERVHERVVQRGPGHDGDRATGCHRAARCVGEAVDESVTADAHEPGLLP